jgi:hypothetical protein
MEIGELIKKKIYVRCRQFWHNLNEKRSKKQKKTKIDKEEDNP